MACGTCGASDHYTGDHVDVAAVPVAKSATPTVAQQERFTVDVRSLLDSILAVAGTAFAKPAADFVTSEIKKLDAAEVAVVKTFLADVVASL